MTLVSESVRAIAAGVAILFLMGGTGAFAQTSGAGLLAASQLNTLESILEQRCGDSHSCRMDIRAEIQRELERPAKADGEETSPKSSATGAPPGMEFVGYIVYGVVVVACVVGIVGISRYVIVGIVHNYQR